MDNGWLELESDPGLFTLLLEDIGVQGVQVEEIYDLTKDIEGPVYGFIFLFKWIEERRSRRKIAQDEESFVTEGSVVNSMFFAQQLIPNSCATHALLSVLLNCDDKLKLSDTLIKLKSFTWGMNPQDKGFAIGNMPELAKAHNKYARPEPRQMRDKQPGISVRTKEAFHFVSYVPINGRLFELDGLRPHPIDHGPWGEQEEWTEKFRRVISERLGMAGGEAYQDIRFNLMAVVTDRRLQYEQKLRTLKTNRQIVLEALQQMVKVTSPHGDMRSRGESVVTRSVAAKEAATSSISLTQTQPLRSARLRQKAAAAAAAAAAIDNEVITLDGDGMSDSVSSALDGHNYAMSPKVEIEEEGVGSAAIDEMDMVSEHKSAIMIDSSPSVDINQLSAQRLKTEREVKIHISVSDDKDGKVTVTQPSTVANTDVTKPLMIQTKFTNNSPGPGSSSTDTASEVGSLLNSPVLSTGQYSPSFATISPSRLNQHHNEHTHSCKHDLTDRLSVDTHDIDIKDLKATSDHMRALRLNSGCMKMDSDISPGKDSYSSKSSSTCQLRSKFGTKQGFTPKDLLALLKNVESEVSQCETNLRDEIEKRRKYKVDACRRTHNYDQFVFTFLSMLAEQGQLAELVEPQIQTKRRQSVSGSNNSSTAKSTATSVKLNRIKKPDRKRAKPKKRR